MPNPPKNDKDRLNIIIEKGAIKKHYENDPARQALWVSLLEPLCDQHIPGWREEYNYS